MFDSSYSESDPLDPGLRAAFSPAGNSVADRLRASGRISSAVVLRAEEPVGDEPAWERPGATGRYRVSGELARGGIGVVLRGRDVDLGRDVALKVLRDEHAENPALTRRLVEEAQIGGQLQHPGILPIYELGLDDARRPFFAMKLIRGSTLAALLAKRDAGADQARFLGIFEQLSHAMAYAHARGVIHRDLKPSNVMVGSFGEVQVVDWGLAKVLSRGSEDETRDVAPPSLASDAPIRAGVSSSISEAGSILGTPAYMPPEQARGEVDRLDERSDVFGLGAILCEILTGHPPYEGERQDVLDTAKRGDIGKALERLKACGASEELIELTRRCLQSRQEDRPRDAGEVARTVQAHRETTAARARVAEIEAAGAKASLAAERRVRGMIVATAGLIVLACAIGGWLAFRAESEKRHAAESQLRAERAERDRARAERELDRERADRLQSALEVLTPIGGKAHYVLLQAAEAADRDLEKWIKMLGLVREIALRSAESAPNRMIRQEARNLATQLKDREDELRERLAKLGRPAPSTP